MGSEPSHEKKSSSKKHHRRDRSCSRSRSRSKSPDKCKPKPKPKPEPKRKCVPPGVYYVAATVDTSVLFFLLTLEQDGTATLISADQYGFPNLTPAPGSPPVVLLTSLTGTWRSSTRSQSGRIRLRLNGFSANSGVTFSPEGESFLNGTPRGVIEITGSLRVSSACSSDEIKACLPCQGADDTETTDSCDPCGNRDEKLTLRGSLSITQTPIDAFPCGTGRVTLLSCIPVTGKLVNVAEKQPRCIKEKEK